MITMMMLMMKENHCADHATATLSTKESFLETSIDSSPLISTERCGGGEQEIKGQCNTYRRSQLGSQLPARPILPTGFTNYTVILLLGKTNKSRCLHSSFNIVFSDDVYGYSPQKNSFKQQ
jgi:hypothetical protein